MGNKPSGQALLIIVLIMAVTLTIGLSVVSRSITDIKISEQTEEAARAFSAAEAGIEQALVGGALSGTFAETGASYQVAQTGLAEGVTEFVFPEEVTPLDIKTLYLANYNSDGTLTQSYTVSTLDLCWGDNAALEVAIYYKKSTGVYRVARGAYDPDSDRRNENKFVAPDGDSCAGLTHKKTLTFTSFGINSPSDTLLFLRLRVFYARAKVGVKTPGGSGGVLPPQGTKYESTGQAGAATRKVEVVRYHPSPPEIFDFALYSGGSLAK